MEFTDYPPIYGLFQKRIDGDDALLQLASKYFKKIRLGAEFYAETIDELRWLMGFNPMDDRLSMVHLGRDLNLFKEPDRELILNFANSFQSRISGIVIHDQIEIETRFDEYLQLLKQIDLSLKKIKNPPCLFIEYAVGLPFDLFISVFKSIIDAEKVCACIDTGHIGIKQIRSEYKRNNYGKDISKINPYDLNNLIVKQELDFAVQSALPAVISIVNDLGKLSKPLHFHLHDGHPIRRNSPFGLLDHLSFLENIVVPSNGNENIIIGPMYGRYGLLEIVKNSLKALNVKQLSYTLEIHPQDKRLPLGKFSYLFDHWHDKTNAEKMNHWIYILSENHNILVEDISISLRDAIK